MINRRIIKIVQLFSVKCACVVSEAKNGRLLKTVFAIALCFCVNSYSFANDASAENCQELITVGLGKNPPPLVIVRQFGDRIQQCLASCDTMYGNVNNADNYNKISMCHTGLETLTFFADYAKNLSRTQTNAAPYFFNRGAIPLPEQLKHDQPTEEQPKQQQLPPAPEKKGGIQWF